MRLWRKLLSVSIPGEVSHSQIPDIKPQVLSIPFTLETFITDWVKSLTVPSSLVPSPFPLLSSLSSFWFLAHFYIILFESRLVIMLKTATRTFLSLFKKNRKKNLFSNKREKNAQLTITVFTPSSTTIPPKMLTSWHVLSIKDREETVFTCLAQKLMRKVNWPFVLRVWSAQL